MKGKIRYIVALLVVAGVIAGGILLWQVRQQAHWQPFVHSPPAYPESTNSHLDGGYYLGGISMTRHSIAWRNFFSIFPSRRGGRQELDA